MLRKHCSFWFVDCEVPVFSGCAPACHRLALAGRSGECRAGLSGLGSYQFTKGTCIHYAEKWENAGKILV